MKPTRTPASDFVQDYAAKRQAQMENAKRIREERLHQQASSGGRNNANSAHTPSPHSPHSPEAGAGAAKSFAPRNAPPPSHNHSNSRSGRVLHVAEEDFRQATQSGIITPDQARQLWAMLSNQIIRVSPTAASVNSLLALSSSSGGSNHASNNFEFGGSVSMESLRQSIAHFKEQQKKMHRLPSRQPNSQPVASFDDEVPAGVRSRAPAAVYDDEEEVGDNAYEPPTSAPRGIQKKKPAGGTGRGSNKPEWNSDFVAESSGFSNPPPVKATSTQRPAANPSRKRPAEDLNTNINSNANAVKKRPAPPADRNSHHQQQQQQGAPVSLDDMPVGGQTNSNAMWSEYPPSSHGGRPSPSSVPNPGAAGNSANKDIAAEAAAAAQEPVKPCGCCGRTFRVSVLPRHEAMCAKQSKKTRKVFDAQGMRMEGVEGLQEVMRSNNYGNTRSNAKKPAAAAAAGGGGGGNKLPKWKIQHEQFQAAMKAVQQQRTQEMGGGGGGVMVGNNNKRAAMPPPAPLPAELDDRVPCPHCGRKFAEETAARHIPKCATTVAKPKGIRPIRR